METCRGDTGTCCGCNELDEALANVCIGEKATSVRSGIWDHSVPAGLEARCMAACVGVRCGDIGVTGDGDMYCACGGLLIRVRGGGLRSSVCVWGMSSFVWAECLLSNVWFVDLLSNVWFVGLLSNVWFVDLLSNVCVDGRVRDLSSAW